MHESAPEGHPAGDGGPQPRRGPEASQTSGVSGVPARPANGGVASVLVGRRAPWLTLGLFATILLLVGADLGADWVVGVGGPHLVIESLALAVALAGVVALWREIAAIRREAQALRRRASALHDEARGLADETQALAARLAAAHADADRWRAEAEQSLRGLGEAIDQQFRRWGLTPAECEVGLLLLKGLSHKEIAAQRATSERTVRQQAQDVYKKAGLAGRAELSAFFLEDLLLPAAPRDARAP